MALSIKGTCELCGAGYVKKKNYQKYCSKECSNENQRKVSGRYVETVGVPTGTVGAISEMVVAADLMLRGYSVFRALSPSCYCDLIASNESGEVFHVEVRTGYFNQVNKKMTYPKNKKERPISFYGIYERNSGGVHYFGVNGTAINV
jgi:hypothetical protein